MAERRSVPTELYYGETPLPTGIQLIDLELLKRVLVKEPSLPSLTLTPDEIDYCRGRTERIGGRIGAKMALFKLLKVGLPWHDIEILAALQGKPEICLSGQALDLVEEQNIVALPLSISHDTDAGLAAAFVAYVSAEDALLQVGIDLTHVPRIERNLVRYGSRFLDKWFTGAETDQARGDAVIIARQWCGKEAIAKTLGTGFSYEGISPKEIEIVQNSAGLYQVGISGNAEAQAGLLGLTEWSLTIDGNPQTPIAFAIGYSA